ncbi:MAG: hypothetical protein OCD76_15925 [Reichenbachiella sp.]
MKNKLFKVPGLRNLSLIVLFGCALLTLSCDDTVDDLINDLDDLADIDLGLESSVDIDDPNQVTAAIQIDGASTEPGNPPSPTTSAGTPILYDDDTQVTTTQNGTTTIELDVQSGDVAGLYFQVEGATDYINIPVSLAARKLEDSPSFELNLAEVFEPGEFCALVCAYNAEDQVSTPVSVCITIVELGGEESGYLVGSWKLLSEVEEDGTVYNVGDDYTSTESYYCDDNTTKEFTETSRTNSLIIDINAKGEIKINFNEYYKGLDWDNTTSCDNLIFEEETEVEEMIGVWSYNNSTKILDLLVNDTDGEDEVITFLVKQDGDNLEFHWVGDEDYLVFGKN